ncbi:redoxin domain-containing protein [Lysinibacillus sp. NPDC097231]|uniref:redoxin domain-containing protein n=1 Tax=Lysinibacillus sp. NPDC097231 TaxID=3364142 RepID=UPI0037F39C41
MTGKRLMQVLTMVLILIALSYSVYVNGFAKEKTKLLAAKQMAPTFILTNTAGQKVRLEDTKGQGLILNFWATYCPPCKKEMPLLDAQSKNIAVITVNVGEPTRLVNQFLQKQQLTLPTLLDREQKVYILYQVTNLPTTFFVNAKGEIVDKVVGELNEQLLKEKIAQIQPK